MADRPCGSPGPHVRHPWDAGRRMCPGAGRYATTAPARPGLEQCTGKTWTGPTGVVWDCVAPEHPTDPDAGYCGSGHTLVARAPVT